MFSTKGFSLTEIVVVLAVITVLGVLSVTGIVLLQRSSRDAQRLKTLQELKSEIIRIQTQTGRVPKESEMVWEVDEIRLEVSGTNVRTVKTEGLSGSKNGSSSVCSSTEESDASGTVYCYKVEQDGYILGADRESGVLDIGTSRKTFAELRGSN